MFRIDPLDETGKFDLNFFSSETYKKEGELLFDYLKTEGFEDINGKFYIDFNGRSWEVTNTKAK